MGCAAGVSGGQEEAHPPRGKSTTLCWLWTTLLLNHCVSAHRSSNHPSSTSHNSINCCPNYSISLLQGHQLTMAYTADDMQAAIAEFSQESRSMRRVCSKYHIPRSTFRSRLLGANSHAEGHIPQQILIPVQEERLSKWVLTQAALGDPPTHSQIRDFASRILEVQGAPRKVGKGWVNRFIRRNPVLKNQAPGQHSPSTSTVGSGVDDLNTPWKQTDLRRQLVKLSPQRRPAPRNGYRSGRSIRPLIKRTSN
jgi:hypothetical protein